MAGSDWLASLDGGGDTCSQEVRYPPLVLTCGFVADGE